MIPSLWRLPRFASMLLSIPISCLAPRSISSMASRFAAMPLSIRASCRAPRWVSCRASRLATTILSMPISTIQLFILDSWDYDLDIEGKLPCHQPRFASSLCAILASISRAIPVSSKAPTNRSRSNFYRLHSFHISRIEQAEWTYPDLFLSRLPVFDPVRFPYKFLFPVSRRNTLNRNDRSQRSIKIMNHTISRD